MHEANSVLSLATTAQISYHWRPLKNNSIITQYFYGLTQRHLAGSRGLASMLLWVCRKLCIVPLHLFICVATQSMGKNGRAVRTHRIYGVSEGSAIPTDGAVVGDWLHFPASTPGYAISTSSIDSELMHDSAQRSFVSHSLSLKLTEAQLCAMNKVIERCQLNFHYKLVGNNCQNVAHDIVEMLRRPSYRPNWVSVDSHDIYLREFNYQTSI